MGKITQKKIIKNIDTVDCKRKTIIEGMINSVPQ
jgi:hypothetical protein